MKWLIGFQQCHTIHIIHLLRIPRLFASRALDPCQRSNVPYQHLWPQRELMLQGMVGVQNDGSKWFKCMKFLCFKDAGGGFFDLFATSFTGKKKTGVKYLVALCWPIHSQYLANPLSQTWKRFLLYVSEKCHWKVRIAEDMRSPCVSINIYIYIVN